MTTADLLPSGGWRAGYPAAMRRRWAAPAASGRHGAGETGMGARLRPVVVIMAPVATAAVADRAPMYPHNRPNLVSVGTIVWLSSELMFFSALFAMYFTVKA